jgi:hypothetical protein
MRVRAECRGQPAAQPLIRLRQGLMRSIKTVDMNLGMDEKPGTAHPWQALSVSAQGLARQPNLW